MPNSGYDQLLATVARQQAAIDMLTGRLADLSGQLTRMDTLAQENSDLRTRLSRAEERADVAARTATAGERTIAAVQNTLRTQGMTQGQAANDITAVRNQVDALATTVASIPSSDAALTDVFVRLARVEDAQADGLRQADGAVRAAVQDMLGRIQTVATAADRAYQAATQAGRDAEAYASDLASRIAAVAAERAEASALPDRTAGALLDRIAALDDQIYADPVLATSRSRGGLQVPSSAVISLAATKLTGDVAAAQMSTNVVAAVNASAGEVDAAKISTGDLPTAQMQANVPAAINASAGGVSAAKVSTGDLPAAQMSTNIASAVNASSGGLSATKVSAGDLPAAQMSTNIASAVNASSGGLSATKVSAGDLPAAQMQTNLPTAFNATTGYSAAALTTGSLGSGRMSANVMAAITASGTDLALGAGQKAGFYGTTPPAQQSVTVLTNNVASGGTANQLDNYTDLTSYSNDAAAIRNNLYRLGEQVNLLRTAVRAYGLLT